MNLARIPARPLCAVAILLAAGAAHATISYVTSAGNPAFAGGSTDTFSDLTINTALAAPVIVRTPGSFSYLLATTLNSSDVNAPSSLYVVPVASTVAVSTGWYTDSLTFTFLSTPTKSFGGNFFATNFLGEFAAGAVTVTVTDVNGASLTQTFSPANASAFAGFTSDVNLRFASVSIATPNTGQWASVDNVVLSAVPEPGGWSMLLAGGLVALRLTSRFRS